MSHVPPSRRTRVTVRMLTRDPALCLLPLPSGYRADPEWDLESLLVCFDHASNFTTRTHCVTQLHRAVVADPDLEAEIVDTLYSHALDNMELRRVRQLTGALGSAGTLTAQDALAHVISSSGVRAEVVHHAISAVHTIADPQPHLARALLGVMRHADERRLLFPVVVKDAAERRRQRAARRARESSADADPARCVSGACVAVCAPLTAATLLLLLLSASRSGPHAPHEARARALHNNPRRDEDLGHHHMTPDDLRNAAVLAAGGVARNLGSRYAATPPCRGSATLRSQS